MSIFTKVTYDFDPKKADPLNYYEEQRLKKSALGFKTENTQKDGSKPPIYSTTIDADFKKFFDQVLEVDENSLESKLRSKSHTRKMTELAINKPLEYISGRNATMAQFEGLTKEFKDSLLYELGLKGINPMAANSYASTIALQLLNSLETLCDTQIYPASLTGAIRGTQESINKQRVDPKGALNEAMKKNVLK